jgi:signal transduction histidine kinase
MQSSGPPAGRRRLGWANLPLRFKGLVVVAIPVVPLLVTSGLWYVTQQRAAEAERAVAHTLEVKAELEHLGTLLVEAELGARGYLLTRSPEALAAFHTAGAAMPTALRHLVSLVSDDPSQIARLKSMAPLVRGRPLSSIIEYVDRTPAGASPPLELLQRSRTAMAALRAGLAEMTKAEDALLETRGTRAAAARRWGTIAAVGGLVVGLGGGLVAALLFTSAVARRVKTVADNADRLASGQPLQPIAPSGDEVGALAAALEHADTLLKQRDAELQRRLEETAAANKELESFSYSVSHDLRAPIRHIAGFASLLEKATDGQLGAESRRYVKTIFDSAARMGRLVDDLLAFSRMARAEMMHTRVDFGELVTELVEELKTETAGRVVIWTVRPLPTVEGDRAMLRLALQNLLSNALKYTGPRARAEIEVGTRVVEGKTALYVRDNGVGFDMAYADKLFGVFQRLHDAAAFEGTGIGLANVQRIVQRHGGQAWAESAPDLGATFFISLPTVLAPPLRPALAS